MYRRGGYGYTRAGLFFNLPPGALMFGYTLILIVCLVFTAANLVVFKSSRPLAFGRSVAWFVFAALPSLALAGSYAGWNGLFIGVFALALSGAGGAYRHYSGLPAIELSPEERP